MVQTTHVPVTIDELRCWRCNRKLAEMVSSPWRIKCSRCKTVNQDVHGDARPGDPAAAELTGD